MNKIIVILLALMLFTPIIPIASADEAGTVQTQDSIYSTYAFTKQLYMNPLSSFLAFDGFEEYYELTEDTLTIIDALGQERSLDITWHEEPMDAAAYERSFMMEGFGIPDITAYKNRHQFTLTSSSLENVVYRIYLMDNEIWLVQLHKDTANIQKQEYIWSIFQIEKFNNSLSVQGTREGVEDFVSLLGNNKQQLYKDDTCYDITPYAIAKTTDYHIFKFDQSCASFLLYENEIYQLGEWFGGLGVVSTAAADLNGDGLNELYFTYSFGSGLHRSHADYFDPLLKQMIALSPAMTSMDMVILQNKTGGLSLFRAAFPLKENFVQYKVLGTEYLADIICHNEKIILNPMPAGN